MKYLFTLIPPQSSYGGGAFFVKNMSEELVKNGHTIVTTLDDDLDIIDRFEITIGKFGQVLDHLSKDVDLILNDMLILLDQC